MRMRGSRLMLGMFGPIMFEIQPVNFTETSRETTAGFAEKSVVGRRQPLEFVGDQSETVTISVKLFPFHFGGLGEVEVLGDIRKAGKPQYYMRGDGTAMGWFVLESMSEKSSSIGPGGVGREISIDLTLKRTEPPGAADYYASIGGMD